MKRTPTAHVVFPKPSAVRPVPEFVWEAVRSLTRTQDLDVDILLPVPVRSARGLQGLLQEAKGTSTWPKKLDEQLRRLEPAPSLVPYLPVPGRSIESAAAAVAARLMRRPRAGRPQVIQGAFLDTGGFVAAMVGRVLGVPSIVTAHGSDVRAARGQLEGESRRRRRALSTLAWANQVIAGSLHLASELARVGVRAQVLPFTSSPELFELSPKAEGPPEVLFVGRLGREKGADVLIEAFARMRRKDARLRLVGPPAEGLDLRAMALRLGLEERVRFEGEVPQGALPSLYARATCLALPARAEGRCSVLVESMLVGRPVVVSRVQSYAELVDERVGQLVEVGSASRLAEALDIVVSQSERGAFEPEALRALAMPMSWRESGPRLAEMTRALLSPLPA